MRNTKCGLSDSPTGPLACEEHGGSISIHASNWTGREIEEMLVFESFARTAR